MSAKKAAIKKTSSSTPPTVVHRISDLLHTMRCIEQHEQQLSVLMHEITVAGVLSADAGAELRDLLEEMPTRDYTDDLEAVRETIGKGLPSPPKKSATKKVVPVKKKKVPAAKKKTAARKSVK